MQNCECSLFFTLDPPFRHEGVQRLFDKFVKSTLHFYGSNTCIMMTLWKTGMWWPSSTLMIDYCISSKSLPSALSVTQCNSAPLHNVPICITCMFSIILMCRQRHEWSCTCFVVVNYLCIYLVEESVILRGIVFHGIFCDYFHFLSKLLYYNVHLVTVSSVSCIE